MSSGKRRRASPEEYERRLAEVTELVVARMVPSQIVRFSVEKWGIGTRAAQKYVAEAMRRLREHSDVDPACELGKAICGYEMIFRRQLASWRPQERTRHPRPPRAPPRPRGSQEDQDHHRDAR